MITHWDTAASLVADHQRDLRVAAEYARNARRWRRRRPRRDSAQGTRPDRS